jgi:hypothetical protein
MTKPKFVIADLTGEGKPRLLINVSSIAYVNFLSVTQSYQVYCTDGRMTVATNPIVTDGLVELHPNDGSIVFVNRDCVMMIVGKEPSSLGSLVSLNVAAEYDNERMVEFHLPESHLQVLEILGINAAEIASL